MGVQQEEEGVARRGDEGGADLAGESDLAPPVFERPHRSGEAHGVVAPQDAGVEAGSTAVDAGLEEGHAGVGHSLGAVATMMAARKEPQRFRALALIEPVFLPPHVLQAIRAHPKLAAERPFVLSALRRRDRWPSRADAFARFREIADEIVALARFGRDHDVEMRFIEFMPLDATGHWLNDKVVGQDEIVAALSAEFPMELVPARGAAPADRWRYLDGRGMVGVIPTVTKPFCDDCDRVRLTADGQFRTCLFATTEFDLLKLMRAGATDDQVAAEIQRAVGTKWAGHQINQVTFVRPRRSMSQIGG